MRAVLDVNVIISALLSPHGAPARLLRAWQAGAFELVVSNGLLAELERALGYPKLRQHVDASDATRVVEWLRQSATVAADPDVVGPVRSPDPGDDYLIALAAAEHAALVSGDDHVLTLAGTLPVFTAAAFLDVLTDAKA